MERKTNGAQPAGKGKEKSIEPNSGKARQLAEGFRTFLKRFDGKAKHEEFKEFLESYSEMLIGMHGRLVEHNADLKTIRERLEHTEQSQARLGKMLVGLLVLSAVAVVVAMTALLVSLG